MRSNADLEWSGNRPYSKKFDDHYFNADGLNETEHVFIQGTGLDRLSSSEKSRVVIGELGFGTGLNFLAAAKHLLDRRISLDFVSFEGFLMDHAEAKRSLDGFDALGTLRNQLLEQWPIEKWGTHRIYLKESDGVQISLTLCLGQLPGLIKDFAFKADAWFLDGFAPDRNPEMWEKELLRGVAERSFAGARIATFTSAGWVRRNLEDAGFDIQKIPGFAGKREMTVGSLRSELSLSTGSPPWFFHAKRPAPKTVAVIGAGIAGCTVASRLAQSGVAVTLFDRQSGPCQETSGNRSAVVVPALASQRDPIVTLSTLGFEFVRRKVPETLRHSNSKVVELAFDEHEQARMEKMLEHAQPERGTLSQLSAREASELAGVPLPFGGVTFPESFCVTPREFCSYLIEDTSIRFQHKEISQIHQQENFWVVGDRQFDQVVVCSAIDSLEFEPLKKLPLSVVRGQLGYFDATASSKRLKATLLYDGFISPEQDGIHAVGSTYQREDRDLELRSSDQDHLIHLLGDRTGIKLEPKPEGRVGLRVGTPDTLPVVGQVPDWDFYLENYRDLDKGKPATKYADGRAVPGLWVLSGLGSKGMIYGSICAEILTDLMLDRCPPVEQKMLKALHPARFWIRDFKRRRYKG